ncbi:hypothetical protein SAMN05216388_101838 [Halorientalis persicus]|jgi:uncharacterized OB-fold protein|uniref:Zinc-ribbon domain-containing protein n=1 Tax=Halorientalis persicus TaxID=1367881 RepID=A0A1H8S9L6_9EURY|nr:hypothetical protein SAMN05216388_101838 [Halorientalis persicus]
MGVRTVITGLLPGGGSDVVVECRNCGTTVSPGTDACPDCGRDQFCRYEIPE